MMPPDLYKAPHCKPVFAVFLSARRSYMPATAENQSIKLCCPTFWGSPVSFASPLLLLPRANFSGC